MNATKEDKVNTFFRLKEEYRALLGNEGNQFLYSTTPDKTTYYVFRDDKITGIDNVIIFLQEEISKLKAEKD